MMFNIVIKAILKKRLVQLMCMVQFLCRLDMDISYWNIWIWISLHDTVIEGISSGRLA